MKRSLLKISLSAAILFCLAACDGKVNSKTVAGVAKEIVQLAESDKAAEDKSVAVAEPTAAVETSYESLGLPKASTGVSEQVLQRTGYVASYNKDWRIPNWVMWRLTSDHVNGPYKREGVKFTPDEDVPNSPTTYDYQRTGYDRGHMCPSADNRWSQQAQQDCFLMTNICPQNHNLNTGDWSEMENQCRRWAEEYGEVVIVCGPILFRGDHKKIAKSIVVPEAFFKVIYCPSRQKAIGFIYRNEAGDRPKGDYVNTVDDVERITGLDFFPNLPADIQGPMEANASLSDW